MEGRRDTRRLLGAGEQRRLTWHSLRDALAERQRLYILGLLADRERSRTSSALIRP